MYIETNDQRNKLYVSKLGGVIRATKNVKVLRRNNVTELHHRAFPVAASRIWNDLPRHVTSEGVFSVTFVQCLRSVIVDTHIVLFSYLLTYFKQRGPLVTNHRLDFITKRHIYQ